MFAIYSKVLNPKFQGTKMGWLTAGGSLARMLGPIWATHAFHFGGGELLFLGTDALVIVSLFVLIIFYRNLGPHPSYFYAQAYSINKG
jgi:MFS transporter, ceroid-lipofuscinosis neuronal protein 7